MLPPESRLPRAQLTADPARTDPARYDAAMVQLCHRLFGGSSPSMAQMPLLPVAPWNQRPGYLVRRRSHAALPPRRAVGDASQRAG